ncbi:MAG: HEPN domain-containing protein [Archaeoglobaceae archaeon]|nr:HEPN domain-containing protein [Archaeoglobaceae archaeon]
MDDPAILWLKFAERDLRSAKKNYEIEEYHVSAFLAQQSAEKALKAIHIKETGSFPKIHDLTRLAKLINAPKDIVKLCAEITPAYTATRYPDVAGEFDKKEVEELIKNAEKVIEWAEKMLI